MATNSSSLNVSQPQIPVFKGESYEFWSTKMKKLFNSQDLWDFVEAGIAETNDNEVRQKENQKRDVNALFFIQQDVDESIFSRIATTTTSKQAWMILKTEYQGSTKVITVKLQSLHRDFEISGMKGNESVQDYLAHISTIIRTAYSNPLNMAYRSSDTTCMTRSSNKDLIQPFENPERVFRSSRKLSKTHSIDYLNSSNSTLFLISKISLKKRKSDHEDANEHIEKVFEIVDIFHIPNITQDHVMLQAFPMSLTGAASHWLRNEPSGLIITWEALRKKFLSKYCPPTRTAKKMEEINNFQQEPDETLYQAWERFKELLMRCPQHYLTDMQEVILFYKGLEVPTRQILDSKGAIPTMTAVDAKLNNLGREIKKVNEKVYAAQVGCELCKGPHYTKDCPLKEEGKTLEEAYYT
ncbi:hypothetical protein Tco_0290053 [Tanacetum coccineum]